MASLRLGSEQLSSQAGGEWSGDRLLYGIIWYNDQRKFRRDTSELRKVVKRVRAGA